MQSTVNSPSCFDQKKYFSYQKIKFESDGILLTDKNSHWKQRAKRNINMASGNDSRRGSSTPLAWDKKKLTGATHWDKVRKNGGKVRLVKGKFLCFVTGAGNGLGRAVAGMAFQDQGILPDAMSGSRVILVDKDEEALKETSGKKMRQFLKHRKIEVELEVVDLEDLEAAQKLIDKIDAKQAKDFEHVIFVNNASSLSDPSKTLGDLEELGEISKYWNVNITSRLFMTTQLCRIFSSSKRTIIHTVRYESNNPTPYLGPSCIAASAVETFAKTFAKENPTVRMLHFCAGALDTKRTHRLIESCGNKDLQEDLKRIHESNKLTNPLEAAKRMIKYIEGNEFKEGEVLYVYDEIEKQEKK